MEDSKNLHTFPFSTGLHLLHARNVSCQLKGPFGAAEMYRIVGGRQTSGNICPYLKRRCPEIDGFWLVIL